MTEEQRILRNQETSADASPAKAFVSDLALLRRSLRATGRAYLGRLEAEIDDLCSWAKARSVELSRSELRDIRDMASLVRRIEIKPQKGRRKDLRKIDATLGELRELMDQRKAR
jgi:hypothetical protein